MDGEVVCVLACLSLLVSPVFPTCWTPRTEDIDWGRLSYPWYDTIDVPKSDKPYGCWNALNFTETDNGVLWVFADYSGGDHVPLIEYMHYTRKSPGVYTMNDKLDVKSFSEPFHHYLGRTPTKKEEKLIKKEVHDLVEGEWIFLTDYENYVIFVRCIGSEWDAFVKTHTPQITAEELYTISQVLIENGLHSSTMLLKNECLNTGDKEWNPADVVIY